MSNLVIAAILQVLSIEDIRDKLGNPIRTDFLEKKRAILTKMEDLVFQ